MSFAKSLLPTWFEQVTSRRTVSSTCEAAGCFSLALFQLSYESWCTESCLKYGYTYQCPQMSLRQVVCKMFAYRSFCFVVTSLSSNPARCNKSCRTTCDWHPTDVKDVTSVFGVSSKHRIQKCCGRQNMFSQI